MEKKTIKTVDMIRKIRDEHNKHLVGKSHVERIAFYRNLAKELEKKISALLKESQQI